MRLRVDEFKGTAPKYKPTQLADGLAVQALNARAGRGLLESWANPSSAGVTLPVNSNYWFRYRNTHWFTWQNRAEAVQAPLVNDANAYACITDESYPKVSRADVALTAAPYPTLTYRLGIPQPAAPSVAVATNADGTRPAAPANADDLDLFTVYYKVTWVDAWGREGPGSLVSAACDMKEYTVSGVVYTDTQTTISRPAVPTGSYNFGTGSVWRIYRANYGSNGTGVFQFVAEVALGTTSYIDRSPSESLQEAMITDDWFGPPDDNTSLFPNGPLRHIGAHPSGFMFGHTLREMAFSEPGTTHAWPIRYQQSVNDDIVTCLLAGGDVVVLTKGVPYVFQGLSPEAMSPIRIPEPLPCVSQDAAVEVDGTVFYASPFGLVALRGTQVQVVSRDYYMDVDWAALTPSSMRLAHYDGRVFILRANQNALVFNPQAPDDGIRELALDPTLHWTVDGTGELHYVARGDATRTVMKFNSDFNNRLTLTYKTKEYRLPSPVAAFAHAKVVSESYPLTLTVYARRESGTVMTFVKTVASAAPFALPGGLRARDWWFKVEGTPQVHSVALAHSIAELND